MATDIVTITISPNGHHDADSSHRLLNPTFDLVVDRTDAKYIYKPMFCKEAAHLPCKVYRDPLGVVSVFAVRIEAIIVCLELTLNEFPRKWYDNTPKDIPVGWDLPRCGYISVFDYPLTRVDLEVVV